MENFKEVLFVMKILKILFFWIKDIVEKQN